jgi:SAM-dependent methyltransferase
MAEHGHEKPSAVASGRKDTSFGDAISSIYESHLVPMLFEPYAVEMAHRVAATSPARVLEIAAGTGVLTRAMATTLPSSTPITATDLNQSMIDRAMATEVARTVEWRQADASQLPFPDGMFDVVVCQFGVMFFPDKASAFSEARRVLKPGGVLLFSVWDVIEENEFAHVVTVALASIFPDDPARFMARTPHGYHDRGLITRDLALGGFFAAPEITTINSWSRAPSASSAAVAFCQGTPLRHEIEARDASRLEEATDVCARALEDHFGHGPIEGKMRALMVAVSRPDTMGV